MIYIKKGCIRTTTRSALTIGQASGIIDFQMRHDADGLIICTSNIDMDTDSTAKHGKPVDFGKCIHKAFRSILHINFKAANGKPFFTSAKRKDGGRERKPMLRGVIVNPLSMGRVTCECFCYRCKAFLRALLFFLHVTFTKAFARDFF